MLFVVEISKLHYVPMPPYNFYYDKLLILLCPVTEVECVVGGG